MPPEAALKRRYDKQMLAVTKISFGPSGCRGRHKTAKTRLLEETRFLKKGMRFEGFVMGIRLPLGKGSAFRLRYTMLRRLQSSRHAHLSFLPNLKLFQVWYLPYLGR